MTIPKNILILATPRSGSTTLLKALSHDIEFRPELFVGNYPPDRALVWNHCPEKISKDVDFFNFVSNRDGRVVIKLMYNMLVDYLRPSECERLKRVIESRKFYVIRLTRDDFKSQVFSLAIADTSKEYGAQSSKKIRCSLKTLRRTFKFLHRNVLALNNNIYNIPIDQDIEFNDVINDNIVIHDHIFKHADANHHKINSSLDKEKKVKNLGDMDRWYEELLLEYGYPTPELKLKDAR